MEDTNWTNDPNSGPAMLAENGALTAFSSTETGRSPKERRIMMTEETKDNVFWGDVNIPMDPESVYLNRQRCIDYLNGLKRLYIVDGFLGFDKDWRMKVRVFIELPYHALFMKNMLVRPTSAEEFAEFEKGVDFTIFNGGMFRADPQVKGVKNKVSVNMNFQDKEQIVLGSLYAGEMKKGMFGVMNYYMPLKGQLSMHCSANEGVKGDTTIFFGLSGTGKTTLSADPTRALIGDDEHVWTETGIFNIEGGCYAKCCFLSREKEPEIYDALKFGTVLENIRFYDFNERSINYDDVSITENTRASYPLEHIAGAKIPAIGTHPSNIIFLTCDAYGILPPVAKLTPDQAMYHFITGYTAKVAGTEVGIKEPVPSFSACFGEAFIPLHPYKYAELLAKKMQKYGTDVWLVNSGWSGGSYPEGARMDLKITRALIDAIHTGELTGTEMEKVIIIYIYIYNIYRWMYLD